MSIPALSVIIPAYNEEKCIGQTIQSIYEAGIFLYDNCAVNIEIIVVDNDSTDQTNKIARELGVSVVKESRRNIAAVRNTGAAHAQAEILCFMDADSKLSHGILYEVYKAMITGRYIGGGSKFKLDRKGHLFSLIFVASVLVTHFTGLSAVLIYTTKDVFNELGGFNEEYYAGEDLFFVLSLFMYAKKKRKRFKNIYRGYIVSSARKFDTIKFKDLLIHGGLLLHQNLRKNPEKCYSWYDDQYRNT
jgi:glycosyltransferase involved in cell wall biosynthesis